MSIHDCPARELARMLRAREIGVAEVLEHYLDRIARLDPSLGGFATVDAAAARERATRMTPAARAPLWGLPHADKDLVARAGMRTEFGSRARTGHVPDLSDALAAGMDALGVVTVGKTATPEFGLTGYTEPQAGRPARDPWNPANGAGGSSGGAAVAVAAGMLPFAVGSDGGGSIRIPAATVGVIGLKPSRGLLPVGAAPGRPGELAVHGPVARTVDDAAFVLDALRGIDENGSARPPGGETITDGVRRLTASRVRIGVTTVSPWDEDEEIILHSDAERAVRAAAGILADAGHAVQELAWHPRGYAPLFRTLWRASAARIPLSESELEIVEPITAWLVREGRAMPPATLATASADARRFTAETHHAFSGVDVVLTPALAQPPRPVGWYDTDDAERAFVQQVQYAPYSSFVNVTGLPAIVIPVTTDATAHPVSVQLIGRSGTEALLLSLATALEQARGPLPHPSIW